MIISEKLYKLRTTSGLSQEELAEKMNVSRQSVSKWESGNSIPGIDKILELSKIYGVSTDFLLQDEIEELPSEVVVDTYEKEEVRKVSLDEVSAYLEIIKMSAGRIALGVLLCIFSPVPMLFLLGMQEGKKIAWTDDMAGCIGAAILLCFVATAVVLFILNGLQLNMFKFLDTDVFQLEYGVAGVVEKEESEYRNTFFKGLSIGVAFCIIAVVPLLLAGGFNAGEEMELYMVCVLLLLVSCGVYLIVHVCIRKSAYDKLLQKGDFAILEKRKNKKLEVFSTVYWCSVTAGYLAVSFLKMNWEISWVVWPVAGVLYAAFYSILGAVVEKKIKD